MIYNTKADLVINKMQQDRSVFARRIKRELELLELLQDEYQYKLIDSTHIEFYLSDGIILKMQLDGYPFKAPECLIKNMEGFQTFDFSQNEYYTTDDNKKDVLFAANMIKLPILDKYWSPQCLLVDIVKEVLSALPKIQGHNWYKK